MTLLLFIVIIQTLSCHVLLALFFRPTYKPFFFFAELGSRAFDSTLRLYVIHIGATRDKNKCSQKPQSNEIIKFTVTHIHYTHPFKLNKL